MGRYVVELQRWEFDSLEASETVTFGPYRSRERALSVGERLERKANTYDDDEAELVVAVKPLRPASTSAQRALDYLYGSIV
jgi:hypothetical protein